MNERGMHHMNTPVYAHGPTRARDSDHAFSAADLWRLVEDNLWLVIAFVVFVTGASILYACITTPIFSADAVIKVDFPVADSIGISSKEPQQVTPSTLPTEAEMQIIQSRTVVMPVIQQYHLDLSITPKRIPLLGEIADLFATPGIPGPALLGLKSFAWGGEEASIGQLIVPPELQDRILSLRALGNNRYELLDPDGRWLVRGDVGQMANANGVSILVNRLAARPDTLFNVVRYSEFTAIERFLAKIKVSESGTDTGIVQIVYENADPEIARAVTNAIATSYVASHINQLRSEAGTTRDFINSELPQLRANLDRAEAALNAYRDTSQTMQPSTEASSYLQGSIEFDRQIATLKTQRAQVASLFAPGSPQVQAIDQQLAALYSANDAFKARFNQLPTSDRKAADLTRDAKIAEEIYVAMLNKSGELAVTRAGTLGNVHIIDTALLPTVPVKPKRSIIIGAGAAAGLILGVLFVFVRDQMSRKVASPHVVERQLSLPVFGAVLFSAEQARIDRKHSPSMLSSKTRNLPRDARMRGAANEADQAANPASRTGSHAMRFLLSAEEHNDMAIDRLRAVRASLEIEIANGKNNVLVIAGATPGTGKSFVAANLAVLTAQAGKRVLLIDADLRRGRLGSTFGQSNSGGLSDLLTGNIQPHEVIRQAGVSGLSILPAGNYPANPAGLLSTLRFQHILEHVRKQYDLVIVDTPAVLAVSDANMVSPHAGSTVLVVRPSVQSEAELEETVKQLDRTGARVIGVIFNAMPRRRSEKRAYAYASDYASQASQS
jgi:tyrosine-protein kinase Etk/Wzc